MEIPRISKITLNMGVGDAIADKKVLQNAVDDMQKIAGQKPIINNARKSVSNFKVREGFPIGCKVTLRRERMYEFLDQLSHNCYSSYSRLSWISVRKSFDGRGKLQP